MKYVRVYIYEHAYLLLHFGNTDKTTKFIYKLCRACICIYIHMYIQTNTYINMDIYIYTYIHMNIYICVHTYIRTQALLYVYYEGNKRMSVFLTYKHKRKYKRTSVCLCVSYTNTSAPYAVVFAVYAFILTHVYVFIDARFFEYYLYIYIYIYIDCPQIPDSNCMCYELHTQVLIGGRVDGFAMCEGEEILGVCVCMHVCMYVYAYTHILWICVYFVLSPLYFWQAMHLCPVLAPLSSFACARVFPLMLSRFVSCALFLTHKNTFFHTRARAYTVAFSCTTPRFRSLSLSAFPSPSHSPLASPFFVASLSRARTLPLDVADM